MNSRQCDLQSLIFTTENEKQGMEPSNSNIMLQNHEQTKTPQNIRYDVVMITSNLCYKSDQKTFAVC